MVSGSQVLVDYNKECEEDFRKERAVCSMIRAGGGVTKTPRMGF